MGLLKCYGEPDGMIEYYCTTRQAADTLRVSENTIRKFASSGLLTKFVAPGVRIARFKVSEVNALASRMLDKAERFNGLATYR